jgi:hypothetical protein
MMDLRINILLRRIKRHTLISFSLRQVYEDQMKLKNKSEAEMILQQCESMITMQKKKKSMEVVSNVTIFEISINYYFHTILLLEVSVGNKRIPKTSTKS